MTSRTHTHCQFIPPYLIERLQPDKLALDESFRSARAAGPKPVTETVAGGAKAWVVHTCNNTSELPGTVVRSAGDPASGDDAVDEAADGITASLALFSEIYGRDSYDGQGASVSLSVHYEQGYDNAYWDGTQLVFGDGDGQIFDRFTKPVDVLGHEFTHAVTERTAGLTYSGQSGALNESVSDAFGSCVKQRLLGQTADQADWLIGEGLFLEGVQGRALRDMRNPGTAYDDPRLGKDPQAADMSGYVDTTDDNGGVHTNSGIPNRAFALAALAVGGDTWEGAGRIWYAALTNGSVTADTDFAGFAAATIAAAGEHADAVRQAWETVGVTPGDSSAGGSGGQSSGTSTVAVTRSGGFAGLKQQGEVDLDADDDRASELRDLVSRVDVAALSSDEAPKPDMFVYEFHLRGSSVRVPEQHLTSDLRRIADLVLGR
ncbi:protealysin inhibitor emfourin [Nocardioides cheoyonin]|uniref:protealysin inhibitor emfourin n=1 Tax=Nocardioides cheoyonin TaxID=3156615 RepID=UPI0032B5E96E